MLLGVFFFLPFLFALEFLIEVHVSSRSIACLSFGLGEPQALTYATGSSWALFGLLEVGLYLKYPEMFEE